MEVDIEIDNPKMMFIIFCSLSIISLGRTENIHVCYDGELKINHEQMLFSETSASQIDFE